jgi:Nucleotidyl transferase AbiEii toxin, Type IV TA system
VSRESRRARFAHLPLLDPRVGILAETQAGLWPSLGDLPEPFVLYGGTGLALRLGHRASADFDFFSATPFVPTELLNDLSWLGRVKINESAPDNLVITTASGVNLSFLGGLRLRAVAEPSLVDENGIVVASIFDLAGTKAKAILDRSEWKDYVDIATLVRSGLTLAEIIGHATTIFERMFEFPASVFLRSVAWFGDGTAPDVPADMQRELERAAVNAEQQEIPAVIPWSRSILP